MNAKKPVQRTDPIAEVRFYDLDTQDPHEKLKLVCRLVAKAYEISQSTIVWTPSTKITEQLNELLWDYPVNRFIPHIVGKEPPDHKNLVRISSEQPNDSHYLLINLTNQKVGIGGKYERIFEIVLPSEFEESKERFSHYDELGCMPRRFPITRKFVQ